MKTIQARVTRNVKEDSSIAECDIWSVETALLEKLPNEEEVSLIADSVEIQVEPELSQERPLRLTSQSKRPQLTDTFVMAIVLEQNTRPNLALAVSSPLKRSRI